MKCVEVYKELYHQEPFDVAFCPYRISPLGAHIDHQYGKINGLAIDKGIHMAYHPKQNGVVELQSLNFPKRAQFFVNAVPEEKQGDWADHLRGAAKMLGEDLGVLLSFLYTELRGMIVYAWEQKEWDFLVGLELFLQVYSEFEGGEVPTRENVRKILYWYVNDYCQEMVEERIRQAVDPALDFAVKIIKGADLTDLRYLYAYGEYVGENELKMAEFMNSLPEEIINTMADTYTEGYRIGFEVTGKDLSKKAVVDVRYQLGFERMMRRALENFEKMGLLPVIYRAATSILYNPSIYKNGFYSVSPNRQYEFDHKDDKALFLDKMYCSRKLEVMHTAFEKYKKEAFIFMKMKASTCGKILYPKISNYK